MDPREDTGRRPRDAGRPESSMLAPSERRRAPRWPEVVWLAILTAIGVVQIVRAQWFDAAVFFGAVLALAADSFGLGPSVRKRRRPALRWLIAGAVVLGAVLCFLPRHGLWMGVAVTVAGVAALIVTWPQPGSTGAPPWSRGLRRLAVAWSVILVAGCLWELLQFVLGRVEPRSQWYALSDLVDPVVASVPGHLLFVAAWIGAGVFLIRRGRRP